MCEYGQELKSRNIDMIDSQSEAKMNKIDSGDCGGINRDNTYCTQLVRIIKAFQGTLSAVGRPSFFIKTPRVKPPVPTSDNRPTTYPIDNEKMADIRHHTKHNQSI